MNFNDQTMRIMDARKYAIVYDKKGTEVHVCICRSYLWFPWMEREGWMTVNGLLIIVDPLSSLEKKGNHISPNADKRQCMKFKQTHIRVVHHLIASNTFTSGYINPVNLWTFDSKWSWQKLKTAVNNIYVGSDISFETNCSLQNGIRFGSRSFYRGQVRVTINPFNQVRLLWIATKVTIDLRSATKAA